MAVGSCVQSLRLIYEPHPGQEAADGEHTIDPLIALTLSQLSNIRSFSLFQLTLRKNLNAVHRIEGVPSHTSLYGMQKPTIECLYVPP